MEETNKLIKKDTKWRINFDWGGDIVNINSVCRAWGKEIPERGYGINKTTEMVCYRM